MLTRLLHTWRQRLTRFLLGLTTLIALFLPLAPAHADAPAGETSLLVQEFQKELGSLQTQQGIYTVSQARRLADLSRLDTALADSTDRPTIANNTTHSLGVFVRSKRQRDDQPATFAVLGSGHETDDDYASVALFIPANVPVSWPGRQPETGATPGRVVPLLPGEELEVSDDEGAKGYAFNLPAYALESESASLGVLPSFSQEELDGQLESAPVD
jgi:hypothetical protein